MSGVGGLSPYKTAELWHEFPGRTDNDANNYNRPRWTRWAASIELLEKSKSASIHRFRHAALTTTTTTTTTDHDKPRRAVRIEPVEKSKSTSLHGFPHAALIGKQHHPPGRLQRLHTVQVSITISRETAVRAGKVTLMPQRLQRFQNATDSITSSEETAMKDRKVASRAWETATLPKWHKAISPKLERLQREIGQ